MSKHRNFVPTLDATGTGKPKFGLAPHRLNVPMGTPWDLTDTELGIQLRQADMIMASLVRQNDKLAYRQVCRAYDRLREEYKRRGLTDTYPVED